MNFNHANALAALKRLESEGQITGSNIGFGSYDARTVPLASIYIAADGYPADVVRVTSFVSEETSIPATPVRVYAGKQGGGQ